jgi:hypothetical protein
MVVVLVVGLPPNLTVDKSVIVVTIPTGECAINLAFSHNLHGLLLLLQQIGFAARLFAEASTLPV